MQSKIKSLNIEEINCSHVPLHYNDELDMIDRNLGETGADV
jgi:hypothetical protein